jgi:hypothetical protein
MCAKIAGDLLIDVWDDLRFPAQAINPAGAAAPPAVSSSTGMLEFSGSVDNVIAGSAQMPHAWKYGTNVHFHLHVLFPTGNAGKNTRWKMEYNVFPLGSATSTHNYGTYTTATVITIPNPNAVQTIILGEFDPVVMTGCLGSSTIMWRVSRLAASDAADDDTTTSVLTEMDIHYQIDKLGSAAETPV